MQNDMSSGYGQADLTLHFEEHRMKGSGLRIKDLQIFVAEYIGTFLLAFFVAATKTADNAITIPFAIGCGLVALIHVFGPISGGQFNPGATVALLFRYKLNFVEAIYSVISQVLGALSAGIVSCFLFNGDWDSVGYPHVIEPSRRPQAFVAEFLQTFALMAVALNTATTLAQANNSYFGMAIGFVVTSGALVIGNVSGACFNPAIAMLTVLHGQYGDLWVFMVAPLLGSLFAGLLFRINNPHEVDESDPLRTLAKNHYNPDGNIIRRIAMLFQEFQGTFFISWTVALSVNVGEYVGPMAITLIIISYIYAGGSVSGAHYNPCVTIAVYLRSYNELLHMRIIDVILYIATQIVGAYSGAGVASYVNGIHDIYSPVIDKSSHTAFQAFLVEFIMSAAIALTVLFTATSEKVSGNSFFGIAIGFMTMAGLEVNYNISGGVFNPAIALALITLKNANCNDLWVYVFGDMFGGVFAAILYLFLTYDGNSKSLKQEIRRNRSKDTYLTKSLLPVVEDGEGIP